MKQKAFVAIMILALSVTFFAQTKTRSEKVAVINSESFIVPQTGIKEFIDSYLKAKEEQKVGLTELNVLQLKIQALKKGFANLPDDSSLLQAKFDELERLHGEYDLKLRFWSFLPTRRRMELMVSPRMRAALLQFKKEKGYTIIVDESTTDVSLIIADENEIPARLTSEFIEFYNKNYAQDNYNK